MWYDGLCCYFTENVAEFNEKIPFVEKLIRLCDGLIDHAGWTTDNAAELNEKIRFAEKLIV